MAAHSLNPVADTSSKIHENALGFMGLSSEARNKIYGHLFKNGRAIGSQVDVSVKVMNNGRKLEAGKEILNSRAIRLLTWDKLHDCDVRRFEMTKTTETSETDEFDIPPADAANADNCGYQNLGGDQEHGPDEVADGRYSDSSWSRQYEGEAS